MGIKDILIECGSEDLDPEVPDTVRFFLEELEDAAKNMDATTKELIRDPAMDLLKANRISRPAKLVDMVLEEKAEQGQENHGGKLLKLRYEDAWSDPVNASELLDRMADTCERYLVLRDGASTALTLVSVHTYCFDLFDFCPFVFLKSPTKECGKTKALNVVSSFVCRPLPCVSISPAALFRVVDQSHPTLLLDECDQFFRQRENHELVGLLNAGHSKAFPYALRVSGDDHDVHRFNAFCPRLFAGIRNLQDTLMSRCIVIDMTRKRKDQVVSRLVGLELDRANEPIRRKIRRFVEDHEAELASGDPLMPEELSDRQQDLWKPLITIADLAGKAWGDRARQAAVLLSTGQLDEKMSVRIELLEDIRTYFQRERTNRIFSADLCDHLRTLEDHPWPEWGRSEKPITPRGVSVLLKPFGILPKTMRKGDVRAKGYTLKDCEEAFERYLEKDT